MALLNCSAVGRVKVLSLLAVVGVAGGCVTDRVVCGLTCSDLVVVKVLTSDGHVPGRLTGEVNLDESSTPLVCPGASQRGYMCSAATIVVLGGPKRLTIRIVDETGAQFSGTFEPRYAFASQDENHEPVSETCRTARIEVKLERVE